MFSLNRVKETEDIQSNNIMISVKMARTQAYSWCCQRMSLPVFAFDRTLTSSFKHNNWFTKPNIPVKKKFKVLNDNIVFLLEK